MKRCEIILVGITNLPTRAPNPVEAICATLTKFGVPANPDWWGCQHAVRERHGLVIAVEHPEDMPIDEVTAIIRRLLMNQAPYLSEACSGVEVYTRCGWNLTGADIPCREQFVFRPESAAA